MSIALHYDITFPPVGKALLLHRKLTDHRVREHTTEWILSASDSACSNPLYLLASVYETVVDRRSRLQIRFLIARTLIFKGYITK